MKVSVCEHMSLCFQVILKLSSPWSDFFQVQPDLLQALRPLMISQASNNQHIKIVRGSDYDVLCPCILFRYFYFLQALGFRVIFTLHSGLQTFFFFFFGLSS